MPGNDADAFRDRRDGSSSARDNLASPKPNPNRFISVILKAFIMTFLTSVFFLFLGLAAVVILLFLACHALHHRRRPAFTIIDHSKAALSPGDLRKIPQFRFENGAVSVAECVVCLDVFRKFQCCRVLPSCSHVFHSSCIDAWLVKVPACPICRAPVRREIGVERMKELCDIGG